MNTVILATDIGYGNIKAVWGAECTPDTEIIFRAIANQVSNGFHEQSNSTPGCVPICVDGETFEVGPNANLSTGTSITDFKYIFRKEYLAYVRGAIHFMFHKTGVHNRIDLLAVGLPVGNYELHKDKLIEICKGEHIIPTPQNLIKQFGKTVKIFVDRVLVIPQPIGALSVYATKCARTNKEMGSALIIDPGYRTLDWIFSHGMEVDMGRSGSFAGGVSVLLRDISGAVGKQLGVGYIDLIEVEKALTTGKIFADGRIHDFTPYQDMVREAAARVIDKFFGAINIDRAFSSIILTGGGGKFYQDALAHKFPSHNIQYEDDSVMSNARGFYSIAKGA